MPITLTYGATVLELPPDLLWANEWQWSTVAQSVERSITGALLIDVATRTGGRPISLRGQENTAWMSRESLTTLAAWAAVPGAQFVLGHNGANYTVIFDHGTAEQSNAIRQLQVVGDFSDPQNGDYYCNLEINLLEL